MSRRCGIWPLADGRTAQPRCFFFNTYLRAVAAAAGPCVRLDLLKTKLPLGLPHPVVYFPRRFLPKKIAPQRRGKLRTSRVRAVRHFPKSCRSRAGVRFFAPEDSRFRPPPHSRRRKKIAPPWVGGNGGREIPFNGEASIEWVGGAGGGAPPAGRRPRACGIPGGRSPPPPPRAGGGPRARPRGIRTRLRTLLSLRRSS